MNRLSCMLLLLAVASVATAAPTVTVTLQAPPPTLPGVPFDLVLTYTNASQRPVAVGALATVTVTPTGGTPMKLPHPYKVYGANGTNESNFELNPGETRTGVIPWQSNLFQDDAAFTGPGTYELTIELTGSAADVGEGYITYANAVRTSTARLTRVTPSGDDATVWSEIQAATKTRCASDALTTPALVASVLENHKNSAYYPYALILSNDLLKAPLSMATDAVERFHDSPAYPHLLVQASLAADQAAIRAEQEHRSHAEIVQARDVAAQWSAAAVETGNTAVQSHATTVSRLMRERLERARATRAEK